MRCGDQQAQALYAVEAPSASEKYTSELIRTDTNELNICELTVAIMNHGRKQSAASPKPAKGTDGRFLPGNNGGGGRPVGSRNKLSEAFLEALASDFDQHGKDAIERVRTEDPAAYLRTIVAIVPKRLELEPIGEVESLTDEQLETLIRAETASQGIPIPPAVRSKSRH